LHKSADHGEEDPFDRTHGNSRCVVRGIFRTGYGPTLAQPLFVPRLAAELRHILGQLPGIAVGIERIAGAVA
jgi:hypothetical protein